MTKPIFVVKIPQDLPLEPVMESLKKSPINNEYYVFTVKHEKDEFEFECYNSPYDEKEFKNLEEFINQLNNES